MCEELSPHLLPLALIYALRPSCQTCVMFLSLLAVRILLTGDQATGMELLLLWRGLECNDYLLAGLVPCLGAKANYGNKSKG